MHESTWKMGYVFFQIFFKFFVFSIGLETKDNSSSVDNLAKANLWRLNIVANANYIWFFEQGNWIPNNIFKKEWLGLEIHLRFKLF